MTNFLHYIKTKFLATETRKRLAENFLSLSILQGLNYILPLITLPYLVRVLGPEKYGLIAFAQAFIGYFMILTDYGFNLSATREISINRENKQKVSEIFSSVLTIKFFLCILSFLILVSLLFIPKFKKDWLVYIFTFGMVLGNVLFPVWFFQGIEKMRYITILNIIAKSIFTVCIFIFIKKMSDFVYVPLINSLGYLVAGMLSLRIVFKNFAVKFVIPSVKGIEYYLKEGQYIFISELVGNLYGKGTIIILGFVSNNNTIVGYYSIAEKIVKVIANLAQPFAQALYPYIVKTKFRSFSIVITYSILVSFFISLMLFFTSKYIFNLLTITDSLAILGLKILSISLFFTIINVIKQPYIYACKIDKQNLKMYLIVGLSFVPICFLLSWKYSLIGTAFSLLYVEIMVFLIGFLLIYGCFKKEKNKLWRET